MAMDQLQEKIRKLKNPLMVDLTVLPEQLPEIVAQDDYIVAYERFCRELLEGLKGVVPSVRFSFDHFAVLGENGLSVLSKLLQLAMNNGFYTVLDAPQALHSAGAVMVAQMLPKQFAYDALVVSPFIGSEGIKPFAQACTENGTAMFVAVRTANRSAADLQDLLTGSRHLYTAAADITSRYAQGNTDRSGYEQVGLLASAGSANAISELRRKYSRMFLLVDGLDTPSGNAKNASLAFDRLGHGAVICASTGITCAWAEAETDGADYVARAVEAAQRMQKNIWRYVTVI